MIKKIFKSKFYPTIMYLSIIIVLILILFNLISLAEDIQEKNINKKITGLAIEQDKLQDKQNQSINETETKQELYSETSYAFFYLIIIAQAIFILILSISMILPRLKEYT